SKPEESDGFEQIVDFLNAHPIKYALTVNPTIYTSCIEQFCFTVKAKTINGEVQLHALVDGKKIIVAESTVRRDVQLEDAEGIDCLPNSTIFEELTRMSSKTTAWNEFSSTMASAIICLATNQKFNFSKYIFESMVRNLDNLSGKFLMYPRKPKRKDTQIPQPSGPTDIVADEAVHKELGVSLVRAVTTASSLEAEQDSGNITKTRSKATPNEAGSLRTTSSGGPRSQETMGDTIAQTRFENVSKLSNDSLLARGNTLRSDEDSLKLKELMELCTSLQQRVLDLEKTKTTQQNEITSLKWRVKKLEQKKRSRTYGLKRLHKVGMSIRVESSGDEEDLVSVQDNADTKMFDVGTLTGDEVFAEQEVAAKGVNLTVNEVTLAQALAALKSVKSKVKGIVIEEPSVPVNAASASIKTKLQDKGKGKMVEPEPVKPTKKKNVGEEKIDEAKIAWDDIQAKVDADYQLVERLQAEEQEQFTIKEKATLFKELLEHKRKHFAAKRAEEKRNKPPTKTQQKKTMINYLKNMEGWKYKDLKSKYFDSIKELFDKDFKRVNLFVDFRTDLVEGSSKRAGEELEQESTKKQKVDEDKDTAGLQSLMEVIPDEEEVAIDVVPLATKIFSQMIKSFDMEDLEDLYKLVKARYGSTRPWKTFEFMVEKRISLNNHLNYRFVEQEASVGPSTMILNGSKECDIRKPIWYLDSGCSRHITGVKSYLHKYDEQPRPKVVFGDNSTCTTKGYGSIKCNGLVFIKVALVNGLKYNLISISQLCDAKYIVQFNKKRGTIFNSNKEVVMIAPRVRDVYVLDMTSSAQESCFFAKAYDNLNWLCTQGTPRNSILVNFCDEKGILQNFSSLYTPEQNSIAKRKNRTLIEAARTMLSESRIPNINFLHVFGCPVYIYNHKDYLGKFDEKAYDGSLLGYSLVSKAFRVFNTRRQQTEETYHITFDESPDAIKFLKPSVENINIAKNKRYLPDEYLHPYKTSQ
ncbi:retrovirus-related pol polyprotein from transposon TNT 1-94, partial [Tanacetum coccineum]